MAVHRMVFLVSKLCIDDERFSLLSIFEQKLGFSFQCLVRLTVFRNKSKRNKLRSKNLSLMN